MSLLSNLRQKDKYHVRYKEGGRKTSTVTFKVLSAAKKEARKIQSETGIPPEVFHYGNDGEPIFHDF